ncbi:MAG: amino acid adenylation domain-containing protein [Oscillospiraceae bacterium]|nr:amino acid adenylation domain-containing protein [Oscillospiraceae bacterium]
MQTNLLDYLRASAGLHPDKTAFEDSSGKISFAGLYAISSALGNLIERASGGVTRRPFIVPVERSHENICAMMGVLSSGNFYVPVDAGMPEARISEIARRLEPAGVVFSGGEAWRGKFGSCGTIVDLAEARNCAPDFELTERRLARVIDTDPAYVLFTSGSTGVPKGIVVPHRAIIDLAEWLTDAFGFCSEDIFANQTPFFFDASVKEIYAGIKNGATVKIMSKGIFSFPLKVIEFLNAHKVTSALWATSAASMLASSGVFEHAAPKYLNKISFAGETLYAKHVNIWQKYVPNATYVNLYGPTEATVDSAWYKIDRRFSDGEVIPIGSACRNMEVFLLDENGAQIPQNGAGETGEICVRGTALAFGYIGDAEKTDEVFVPDPRNKNWREYIYKTGDLARYNDYGELVFVSRRDGQIKHMGARVELGDVEAAALSIGGVASAVCLHDAARERIVLFYTGEKSGDIVQKLRGALPAYMCPGEAIWLGSMPMTKNGKIDRVALNQNYRDGAYAKNR